VQSTLPNHHDSHRVDLTITEMEAQPGYLKEFRSLIMTMRGVTSIASNRHVRPVAAIASLDRTCTCHGAPPIVNA
jgi:hypothetical protein